MPAPRLNKVDRQQKRMFEPLVMAHVINPVQGARISEPLELYGSRDSLDRHRVLNTLCEMCDCIKGGRTVTALVVENTPSNPVYWVASNDMVKKIGCFLRKILGQLSDFGRLGDRERNTAAFAQSLYTTFTRFNRRRINQTHDWFLKHLRKELSRLDERKERTDQEEYIRWLRTFDQELDDTHEAHMACGEAAYNARFSPFKAYLIDDIRDDRPLVRHYLGRLGAIYKASKLLADAATSHFRLFENAIVVEVPTGLPIDGPRSDQQLNLEGIARRMFSKDSKQLGPFLEALTALDLTMRLNDDNGKGVIERIRDQFDSKTFRPQVHAELAVLEAVHNADIDYYDDDRYIACSKPACFCCYHYIGGHEGEFVPRASHNKIYLNWRPAELPDPDDAVARRRQQLALDNVTKRAREAAEKQVLRRGGLRYRHTDSTTGITATDQAGFHGPPVVPGTSGGSGSTISPAGPYRPSSNTPANEGRTSSTNAAASRGSSHAGTSRDAAGATFVNRVGRAFTHLSQTGTAHHMYAGPRGGAASPLYTSSAANASQESLEAYASEGSDDEGGVSVLGETLSKLQMR